MAPRVIGEEELGHRFGYYAPDDDRAQRHAVIRLNCLDLALSIDTNVPEGREKSVAITKLEEVMFWANAAIARELT